MSSSRISRWHHSSVQFALAMLWLLFCSVTAAAFAADAFNVSQRNRRFSPDTLEVPRGAVVQIVNDDKVTHHIFVDAPGFSFDSGEQPVGKTVELHFDKPGTYPVRCAIHPTMRLQVTVK
jgi:plastocyanin